MSNTREPAGITAAKAIGQSAPRRRSKTVAEWIADWVFMVTVMLLTYVLWRHVFFGLIDVAGETARASAAVIAVFASWFGAVERRNELRRLGMR